LKTLLKPLFFLLLIILNLFCLPFTLNQNANALWLNAVVHERHNSLTENNYNYALHRYSYFGEQYEGYIWYYAYIENWQLNVLVVNASNYLSNNVLKNYAISDIGYNGYCVVGYKNLTTIVTGVAYIAQYYSGGPLGLFYKFYHINLVSDEIVVAENGAIGDAFYWKDVIIQSVRLTKIENNEIVTYFIWRVSYATRGLGSTYWAYNTGVIAFRDGIKVASYFEFLGSLYFTDPTPYSPFYLMGAGVYKQILQPGNVVAYNIAFAGLELNNDYYVSKNVVYLSALVAENETVISHIYQTSDFSDYSPYCNSLGYLSNVVLLNHFGSIIGDNAFSFWGLRPQRSDGSLLFGERDYINQYTFSHENINYMWLNWNYSGVAYINSKRYLTTAKGNDISVWYYPDVNDAPSFRLNVNVDNSKEQLYIAYVVPLIVNSTHIKVLVGEKLPFQSPVTNTQTNTFTFTFTNNMPTDFIFSSNLFIVVLILGIFVFMFYRIGGSVGAFLGLGLALAVLYTLNLIPLFVLILGILGIAVLLFKSGGNIT
jgi:hypothetical protein